jgi:uncharacterized delta-60 repeat protein
VRTSVGGSCEAEGIALQADGKILVAGRSGSYPNYDITLVRYHVDGSLDTSFGGGDGIVTTDFGGSSYELARGIALQADGKIILVGTFNNSPGSSPSQFSVARYNTNGTLDTTFSGDDSPKAFDRIRCRIQSLSVAGLPGEEVGPPSLVSLSAVI